MIKPRTTTVERKDQIIEVATELFYTNGYDNTSTRELAAAVGLSVAGVYYFFRDKEEILFTILQQSIIDLNHATAAAISEDNTPEESIRSLIDVLCRHSISHKKELSILNREQGRLNDEQQSIIYGFRRESYVRIKSVVSRLKEAGCLRPSGVKTTVFNLFAVTTWVSRWYDENGKMSIDEIIKEIADELLYGLLKRGG